MPQEGQKSVTISEDVYNKAKKRAKKEHRSIANFIESCILKEV